MINENYLNDLYRTFSNQFIQLRNLNNDFAIRRFFDDLSREFKIVRKVLIHLHIQDLCDLSKWPIIVDTE